MQVPGGSCRGGRGDDSQRRRLRRGALPAVADQGRKDVVGPAGQDHLPVPSLHLILSDKHGGAQWKRDKRRDVRPAIANSYSDVLRTLALA
jgi:hypothetical protein